MPPPAHSQEKDAKQEIARVLGCSVGTVESGIHRARKKLRYYLSALEPTAGDPAVKAS